MSLQPTSAPQPGPCHYRAVELLLVLSDLESCYSRAHYFRSGDLRADRAAALSFAAERERTVAERGAFRGWPVAAPGSLAGNQYSVTVELVTATDDDQLGHLLYGAAPETVAQTEKLERVLGLLLDQPTD